MHKTFRTLTTILALLSPAAWAQQPPAAVGSMVPENATVKASEHVYVIPDPETGGVPNVGIITGSRAALVIDTGLGPRNGETVLRETRKVTKAQELYLATTHIHPEHDLGASAFPMAKMLRSRDQEKDIADAGLGMANRFAKGSPLRAELLNGVTFRKADISFDHEYQLDLGGVRVRMFSVGPTHTFGDTAFYVEPDRVLFTGDVVMAALPALNPGEAPRTSSVRAWLAALDRFDALTPKLIVPSHGRMGDASLIAVYRDYFRTLQARGAELKRQGRSMTEAVAILEKEIQAKFPNMQGAARISEAARVAYEEAP